MSLSPSELGALVLQGGLTVDQAVTAVAIALEESGGDPTAINHNTDGSIDVGLWQINSSNWANLSRELGVTVDEQWLQNPYNNFLAMKALSSNGTNFQGPWLSILQRYEPERYQRVTSGDFHQQAEQGVGAPDSQDAAVYQGGGGTTQTGLVGDVEGFLTKAMDASLCALVGCGKGESFAEYLGQIVIRMVELTAGSALVAVGITLFALKLKKPQTNVADNPFYKRGKEQLENYVTGNNPFRKSEVEGRVGDASKDVKPLVPEGSTTAAQRLFGTTETGTTTIFDTAATETAEVAGAGAVLL